MLNTRRMEHGSPILADFDLGGLMAARKALLSDNDDPGGITELVRILAISGGNHAVRRLSAVVRASNAQLRMAENGDRSALAALEEEAAERPFSESFRDAIDFFGEWGSSFGPTPVSSQSENVPVVLPIVQGGSPSEDS